MIMNFFYIIAAVLLILIGIVHSWLGEKYILIRLFRRDNMPHLFGSDIFTKQTLRFAWHITTIAWWGFALILLFMGNAFSWEIIIPFNQIISITFLLTALLAGFYTRGKHLSWIIFLAVAILSWFG